MPKVQVVLLETRFAEDLGYSGRSGRIAPPTHGRALQQPARVDSVDCRTPHRLHPRTLSKPADSRRPENRGAAETFGVKTAWHGPGDVSPVGHMANVTLDVACHNFGIQVLAVQRPTQEIFQGCPVMKDGYLWVSEKPDGHRGG